MATVGAGNLTSAMQTSAVDPVPRVTIGWTVLIRKLGWHWHDQVEFVSSGQTGSHFSDIIK